ncbi:protein lingerer-like [Copidosoma floridanum]|uniref:protein lingerer-like n=1 Tax=Copidosoma floridanum TaxID=29053 RepID=UPI0006C97F45|nr:protein lingerer-like [Copidosoma floridanum]
MYCVKVLGSTFLHGDDQCAPNDKTINTKSAFMNLSSPSQSADLQKQDVNIQTSHNTPSFTETPAFQTSKSSYSTSAPVNSYSPYSCSSQSHQTSFPSSTSNCNTSNFSTTPATQTSYSTSFTQANMATYSQTSPTSSATPVIYNQTSSTNQGYQSSTGLATIPITQYQAQSSSTNSSNHNTSYISSGYHNAATFKSSSQAYQQSNTTFTTSMSQASNAYSNTVQSVYSNTYSNYGCQTQSSSQDHKLHCNKDLQYENNVITTNNSLTTTTGTLGLTSNSANSSQTKTTLSNTVPKSSISGLVTSSSTSNTVSASGTTGNIPPVLSHQYIMGQSVPYATFQQPHMYSYEDLQIMQQRIPHMPTTGYYDAALGYQTTGPVTSLGNSRSDALSGVQAVQGQYTSMNDARFARTDSNASPVSSTISQQTATQHQQPLINPIPPGYAYFYGGGIMPAGGFQYGTPAIYPQIATAGNAGSTSGAYNTKPATYSSGYGGSTNYDTLTNSGTSGDYKSSTSGYSSNQSNKNGSSSGNTNVTGSLTDINTTLYTKGHVTLNKVNSYEKQTFHSATPPPFGLSSNQNANVISGYGAHLFIPTVPHQLHQPLHQDSSNSSGQRTNSSSQNKAQVKPGYSTSYWAGSN